MTIGCDESIDEKYTLTEKSSIFAIKTKIAEYLGWDIEQLEFETFSFGKMDLYDMLLPNGDESEGFEFVLGDGILVSFFLLPQDSQYYRHCEKIN